MFTVYTLADRQGNIYIGQTTALTHQLRTHVTDVRRGRTTPVARWLRAMIERGERPRVERVLTVEDRAVAAECERMWAAFCRTLGYTVLNCYTPGYVPTFTHRRSISTAMRNHK